MGLFSKSVISTSSASVGMSSLGMGSRGDKTAATGMTSKGDKSRGAKSTGAVSRAEKIPLPEKYRIMKSKSPRNRKKASEDLSNAKIDEITSKVKANKNKSKGSKHKRSTDTASQRQGRSTVPKSIPTAIIPSLSGIRSKSMDASRRTGRTLDMSDSRTQRSRSADPENSKRGRRSISPMKKAPRSRSAEPSKTSTRSRSADATVRTRTRTATRSSSRDLVRPTAKSRQSRHPSPSDPSKESPTSDSETTATSSLSKSSSATSSLESSKGSSKSGSVPHGIDIGNIRSDAVPFLLQMGHEPSKLGKEMTYIADGMNLDRNARYLLAAFDAKTLEDFYLMTDNDFSAFCQRAKGTKHSLPPLQIRKVQMLRRWIKEVVDDNMEQNEETSSRVRRSKVQIIPSDWKQQYKNDLPHLKLQLRQQGDSIFEKIKNLGDVLTCGAGTIY